MKFILKSIAAVVVALLLGVGSAVLTLNNPGWGDASRNGAWRIDTQVGSMAAGIYARAWVARHGLLALDRSEAIYFIAFDDDTGRALEGACHYVVQGRLPPALWSSITVYGDDNYLVPNEQNRWSYPLAAIAGEDGSFSLAISPAQVDGPWLPVKPGGGFNLFLRLYQPETMVVEDPTSFVAPSIVRQGCS